MHAWKRTNPIYSTLKSIFATDHKKKEDHTISLWND